jgi:hypothetical protein
MSKQVKYGIVIKGFVGRDPRNLKFKVMLEETKRFVWVDILVTLDETDPQNPIDLVKRVYGNDFRGCKYFSIESVGRVYN